jgi:hypothetical protein
MIVLDYAGFGFFVCTEADIAIAGRLGRAPGS